MLKDGVKHVAFTTADNTVPAGVVTMFAVMIALQNVAGDKSCFPYTHPPSGDII